MTAPYKDITLDPNAKPTSNELSPAAAPITPGVRRPGGAQPKDITDREIGQGLADRIARYFGFTRYRAEVPERVMPVVVVADLSTAQEQDPATVGPAYRIFKVDLSVARPNPVPIDGTKELGISNVTVVGIPAGASFNLHIGDRDPIPFGANALGIGTAFDLNPVEQRGLSIDNAAQGAAGNNISIMVSQGSIT